MTEGGGQGSADASVVISCQVCRGVSRPPCRDGPRCTQVVVYTCALDAPTIGSSPGR
jgi:hypothetical protein